MKTRRAIAEEEERRYWQRAREYVGNTLTDQLSWLLCFIDRDVSRLAVAERVIDGYCLKVLLDSPALPDHLDGTPDTSPVRSDLRGPLPDRTITRLHRELRAGIHALFAPPPPLEKRFRPDTKPTGWRLPSQEAYLVRLPGPVPRGKGYRPERDYRFMRTVGSTDERSAIIDAVVRLIERSGNALRSCKECGKAFLGKKRQEYCEASCSQKKRNRDRSKGGNQ